MKEITVKTKFDLGESAFYYDSTEHKLKEHRIELVSFMVDATSVKIWYYNRDGVSFSEDLLFRSKQEFIDSL